MNKKTSEILMWLSVVTVVIAGYVSLGKTETVFGLAGTQWILIGIVLGIYGLYTKKTTTTV